MTTARLDRDQQRLLAQLDVALAADPPSLPCVLLYDERGAELFTEICRLPEYYPTRTELAIMQEVHRELPALLPDRLHLVESGSGEGVKTQMVVVR